MNPAEKHLAIRTEDHPIEYADFEGLIPEGQYGAGTVMVWDKGTYEPKDGVPPERQLARGKIDIVLYGVKLRGGLVKTPMADGIESWLLLKQRDEYANPSWSIKDVRFDHSVLTGRRMKEIASDRPKQIVRRALSRGK
jgi:bifunctional non-homologous end joining protein LigD